MYWQDRILYHGYGSWCGALGRATSGSVDALVAVVNPGSRSRVAAERIRKLGQDIGIKRIVVLGNRVRSKADEQLIADSLPDFEIIGFLPEFDEIIEADRKGIRPFDDISTIPPELKQLTAKFLTLG